MHAYKIHTDDNKVHHLSTEKHHTHPDYQDSIEKWWNANKKGLAITGTILLITHNDRVIWKK